MTSLSTNNFTYFSGLIAIAISLQFGYVFGGASRVIPAIVFMMLSIFFSIYIVLGKIKVKSEDVILFIFFILCILIWLFFWSNLLDFKLIVRTIFYVFYILLFWFVLTYSLMNMNFEQKRFTFLLGLVCCTTAALIEVYFRITMPALTISDKELASELLLRIDEVNSISEFIENKSFYDYKESSVMFFDSNATALFIAPIIISTLFYKKIFNNSLGINFLFFLNILLLLLTFSRAVIFVVALVLVFHYLFYLIKRKLYILLYSLFLILIYPLFYLILSFMNYIVTDYSFLTKIDIFISISEVFDKKLTENLFGFGFVEGGYVYSYLEGAYAHSIIPLLLGEVGIIGSFIYLLTFTVFCYKAGLYGGYIFFIFMVSGISFIDLWQVTFFWSLIYMSNISKNLMLPSGHLLVRRVAINKVI